MATTPDPGKVRGRHKRPLPAAADGVDVNVCRNTLCAHFGLAAQLQAVDGTPARHRVSIAGGWVTLRCLACGQGSLIKSNAGVMEECERQRAYLRQHAPACPAPACATLPVSLQRFGKTPSGTPRFRCNHCRGTFSRPVAAAWKQKRPQVNAMVLRLLVNKVPMRRILEVADITAPTLYRKLDFVHQQCLRFAAPHERRLRDLPISQWNLGTDRQDYLVNWGSHLDRRSFVLRGLITADNHSGYILGTHTNFDPTLDPMATERTARACGDYDLRPFERRFARIWLAGDYVDRAVNHGRQQTPDSQQPTQPGLLSDDIDAFLENFEMKRPARGVQVRQEYVTLAHFLFLKQLLPPEAALTLCVDREPALRQSALAVFADAIRAGRCQVFILDITKGMTVDERERSVLQASQRLDRQRAVTGGGRDAAALHLLEEAVRAAIADGVAETRWIPHPKPHRAEPEKRLLLATLRHDVSSAHLAAQMLGATLSYTDRFMMIVRRRLSLLERPLRLSHESTRAWFAYSPYDPAVACRVLELLRVVFNFHLPGKDAKTPAMRLGLTDRPVTLEEIVGIRRVDSV